MSDALDHTCFGPAWALPPWSSAAPHPGGEQGSTSVVLWNDVLWNQWLGELRLVAAAHGGTVPPLSSGRGHAPQGPQGDLQRLGGWCCSQARHDPFFFFFTTAKPRAE